MPRRAALIIALSASLGSLGLLYLTRIPLGIPGEWTWNRIPLDADALRESAFGWLPVLVVASLAIAYVSAIQSRIDRYGCGSTAAALAGLAAFSLAWLGTVQQLPPSPHPQVKGWVLYYPHMSGYFHLARYEMTDAAEFLRTYEERMAEGDVGHVGTHPPGLFLLHRGLWNLCREHPVLTRMLNATLPDVLEQSFDELAGTLRSSGIALTSADRASLWLAILLTHVVAALTCVPIFYLVRRDTGPAAAWVAASLWCFVPALAVFLPKSDVLYPCLGMLFLLCWSRACRAGGAGRLSAVLAGAIFWFGCWLSLAMIPCGLAAGFFSLYEWRFSENRREALRRGLAAAGLAVGAFCILCGLVWVLFDLNLFRVWLWNYSNHSRFYAPENFPRTGWLWLLENSLETLFAVGAPLCVLGVWGFGRALRRRDSLKSLVLGCATAWALIWLSGKNSGEAARLWLVFFPWVCLSAAACFDRPSQAESEPGREEPSRAWLVLQALVAALTVWRVTGFHT